MKSSATTRHLLLGAIALAGAAALHAVEVPKKAPLTRYQSLWNESPFTTKPPPPGPVETVNPFEDLALRGIAPLSNGGYLITLVNRKNPEETTSIDTERSSDYKVVKVERNPEKRLGTVVHLTKGTVSGTVEYDEKISSAPKTAKPPKANQPNQPGQPPGAPAGPQLPGAPQNDPNRQGRRTVVPPPATTPGAPAAPTAGAPGAPPTAPGTFNRGGFSGGRPDIRGTQSRERPSRR